MRYCVVLLSASACGHAAEGTTPARCVLEVIEFDDEDQALAAAATFPARQSLTGTNPLNC
jgi:hypothetical protein